MLFSIPQNGELTLRKFGDSNLLITPMVSDGRDTDEQVAGMGTAEVRKSLPLRGSQCVETAS